MSYTPQPQDFTLEQGSTWNDSVTIQLPNPPGGTYDLSGYSALLRVSRQSAPLMDFSTKNGKLSIPTPTNGTITLAPSITDMQKLPVGTLTYELVIFNATIAIPLISGNLTITPPGAQYWS